MLKSLGCSLPVFTVPPFLACSINVSFYSRVIGDVLKTINFCLTIIKEALSNSLAPQSSRQIRHQGIFYSDSGSIAKEDNAESGSVCSTLRASV